MLGQIRILLVDDHDLMRRNIRQLLAAHADFHLIGEPITGIAAIEEARKHQPDVILLDISLPQLSGLAALPLILKESPNMKVLMISNHDEFHFARASLSAGARGFLTKSYLSGELAQAIRQVHANEIYISPSLKLREVDKSAVPVMGNAEA